MITDVAAAEGWLSGNENIAYPLCTASSLPNDLIIDAAFSISAELANALAPKRFTSLANPSSLQWRPWSGGRRQRDEWYGGAPLQFSLMRISRDGAGGIRFSVGAGGVILVTFSTTSGTLLPGGIYMSMKSERPVPAPPTLREAAFKDWKRWDRDESNQRLHVLPYDDVPVVGVLVINKTKVDAWATVESNRLALGNDFDAVNQQWGADIVGVGVVTDIAFEPTTVTEGASNVRRIEIGIPAHSDQYYADLGVPVPKPYLEPWPDFSGLSGDMSLIAGAGMVFRDGVGGDGITDVVIETSDVPCEPCRKKSILEGNVIIGGGDDGCITATPRGGNQLALTSRCKACCTCEDYIAVLDDLKAVCARVTEAHTRAINGPHQVYENIVRMEDDSNDRARVSDINAYLHTADLPAVPVGHRRSLDRVRAEFRPVTVTPRPPEWFKWVGEYAPALNKAPWIMTREEYAEYLEYLEYLKSLENPQVYVLRDSAEGDPDPQNTAKFIRAPFPASMTQAQYTEYLNLTTFPTFVYREAEDIPEWLQKFLKGETFPKITTLSEYNDYLEFVTIPVSERPSRYTDQKFKKFLEAPRGMTTEEYNAYLAFLAIPEYVLREDAQPPTLPLRFMKFAAGAPLPPFRKFFRVDIVQEIMLSNAMKLSVVVSGVQHSISIDDGVDPGATNLTYDGVIKYSLAACGNPWWAPGVPTECTQLSDTTDSGSPITVSAYSDTTDLQTGYTWGPDQSNIRLEPGARCLLRISAHYYTPVHAGVDTVFSVTGSAHIDVTVDDGELITSLPPAETITYARAFQVGVADTAVEFKWSGYDEGHAL